MLNIEKELKKNKIIPYITSGTSMCPLFASGRNVVNIEEYSHYINKNGEIKKYDIILFKNNKKLYLHRLIKIKKQGQNKLFCMRGDNCITSEKDIKEDKIIGVMKSYISKGKEISPKSIKYRVYSRAIVCFHPLVAVKVGIYHRIRSKKDSLILKNK